MILDVTAGNRTIWSRNRNPENVIFIDKEPELFYPPDILADNRNLPIRLGLKIESIIFDPPWGINLPPWWLNKQSRTGNGGIVYYGNFKSKRECISYLHKAHNEFKKYTDRLCFKWGERDITLWAILGLFVRDGWQEIHRVKLNTKMNASGESMNQTWWVVLKNGGT